MRLVGGAAFVAQALETLHSAQPAVAVLSALAIAAGGPTAPPDGLYLVAVAYRPRSAAQ